MIRPFDPSSTNMPDPPDRGTTTVAPHAIASIAASPIAR